MLPFTLSSDSESSIFRFNLKICCVSSTDMNSAMVNRDRAPAGDLESAGSDSRGLGSVWAQSGRNEGQAHKCEHGGDIPVYL